MPYWALISHFISIHQSSRTEREVKRGWGVRKSAVSVLAPPSFRGQLCFGWHFVWLYRKLNRGFAQGYLTFSDIVSVSLAFCVRESFSGSGPLKHGCRGGTLYGTGAHARTRTLLFNLQLLLVCNSNSADPRCPHYAGMWAILDRSAWL